MLTFEAWAKLHGIDTLPEANVRALRAAWLTAQHEAFRRAAQEINKHPDANGSRYIYLLEPR